MIVDAHFRLIGLPEYRVLLTAYCLLLTAYRLLLTAYQEAVPPLLYQLTCDLLLSSLCLCLHLIAT